jgi:hypothetical protein
LELELIRKRSAIPAKDQDITIKPTDNSQVTCLLNREDYVNEGLSARCLGDINAYARVGMTVAEELVASQAAVSWFIHGELTSLIAVDTMSTILPASILGDIDLPTAFTESLIHDCPRPGPFYLLPNLHRESAETQRVPLHRPCRPIRSMIAHHCE